MNPQTTCCQTNKRFGECPHTNTNTKGWRKAHRVLFSMAMRHQLTPTEYVEACRYWDDLYAEYRADLDDLAG